MWLRGSKIWSRMCHIFWLSIILSIFSKMFQNIHVLMLAIFVEFSQVSVVSAVFPWKSIISIIPYQITQHSTFQKHPIFERKCISLTNYNDFQLLKFKSQFVEFEWMFISRCVLRYTHAAVSVSLASTCELQSHHNKLICLLCQNVFKHFKSLVCRKSTFRALLKFFQTQVEVDHQTQKCLSKTP